MKQAREEIFNPKEHLLKEEIGSGSVNLSSSFTVQSGTGSGVKEGKGLRFRLCLLFVFE